MSLQLTDREIRWSANDEAGRLEALSTWRKLNAYLRHSKEDECKDLLQTELENGRRNLFASRIYSRYNKLRAIRERTDILLKCGS